MVYHKPDRLKRMKNTWMIKDICVAIMVMTFFVQCKNDDNSAPDEKEEPVPEGYYRNPVFTPTFADPTVIKAGDGFFYAYATEDGWDFGKPAHIVPVIRSRDLVTWEFMNDAFATKPSWKSPAFVWAPDINLVGGKYYLYYSLSLWDDPNPGIGLAVSESPAGPFEDKGKILQSNEVGVANSIDPFYYEEGNKKYLFWGSFRGIYGVSLTDNGMAITGDKFQVAGDWMEGAYIFKRSNYYYLFGSNGHCCLGRETPYKVLIGRSAAIEGPYLNQQGQSLITHQGNLFLEGDPSTNVTTGFAGPGHNAEIVTDDEGTDWFLYHAVDKSRPYLPNDATRRPLMIDRIEWVNDWPQIAHAEPSDTVQPKPVFLQ
jgi:arabinan endo-1,5-alpha-L-arabinosidase